MNGMRMASIGMLIALTAIGAAIKIPAIIGSVALDAFPALLASALLGGPSGAAVGGMGHLLSAFIGGMPLGPFHGMVAIEMAALSFLFSILYRNGKRWRAGILFVLGNAFLAPLPFYFLLSKEFYLSIVPSLLIGSVLNTAIALIVIPRLTRILEPILFKARDL